MKIGTYVNFKVEEDIQIQTACGRILFKLTVDDDAADLSKILIRLRIFSSRGSSPVIETRTPLSMLFEAAAQKEGFYREETGRDANNQQVVILRGFVEVSSQGALALNSDQYLSLDVVAENTIGKMELWAASGPLAVTSYIRYTPITVQETIKDIPLAGVDSLLYRPSDIDTLKIQYAETSPEFEREELEAIACTINDLVKVNFTTGTVRAGFMEWTEMKTAGANRATITPNGLGNKFTIYALSTQKL